MELDEAFRLTVDHQLHNVRDLAALVADTKPLREACERAQQEPLAHPQDRSKLAQLRDLLRLAAELQVSVTMDPRATAALL
jgi:hypothetical protein